jgi:hypothetical protein
MLPTEISLYYDASNNYFVNRRSEIIYDLFRYVTPSKFLLIRGIPGYHYVWAHNKCYDVCEIYIPGQDELIDYEW